MDYHDQRLVCEGASGMIAMYRYLAMGAIALALIVATFFYGVHNGKLAGMAKYNALVASINASTAKATTDAKAAQQKSDMATEVQLQAALQTAQQAVVDMQTLENQRNATIQSLTNRVKANETNPTVAAWAAGRIPDAALSGLCWPSGDTAAPNCNGH